MKWLLPHINLKEKMKHGEKVLIREVVGFFFHDGEDLTIYLPAVYKGRSEKHPSVVYLDVGGKEVHKNEKFVQKYDVKLAQNWL
jgi:hypothetical protein